MLFKHPELLYGLFLLVIPVLVHLFQLRRFKVEKFTNVRFLKKAALQTRKSSRIKKWLILLLRLLIFACIIISFAQPFIPSSGGIPQKQARLIYLDNSHSMQAKGQKGNLLKRSIQDLLEILPREEKISLFTNNEEFIETDYEHIKKELQRLPYSPTQLDWKTISGKAENYFTKARGTEKILLAISDFQVSEEMEEFSLNKDFQSYLVKLRPERESNIGIDTAFISEQSLDEKKLSISIRSYGTGSGEIPISIYNGPILLGKRTLKSEQNEASLLDFPLPSGAIKEGRIEIEEPGLDFDNTLYFSINEKEPIHVVVIGEGDQEFLERIYTSPEFTFESFSTNQLDFSELSQADLIILNEAEEIPLSLNSSLAQFVGENVFLVIIPSNNAEVDSYNLLLQRLGLPKLEEKITGEKLINEVVYDHPLFTSVFEDQVQNFQYPKVNTHFRLTRNAEKIIGLENNQGFLVRKDNVFLFTAALNRNNSNFQDAPLIVPTFYNLGNLALTPSQLYYILGSKNKIDVGIDLNRDEILDLASGHLSFIPLQQSFPDKVVIDLEDEPKQAGHYEIRRDSTAVRTISFNVTRQESLQNYHELNTLKDVQTGNSIPAVFEAVESKSEINALWKWFVIFALFFLITEMLILKYFK